MGAAILVIACVLLKQVRTKPREVASNQQESILNPNSQMETGD
jgi:hypothetical protein